MKSILASVKHRLNILAVAIPIGFLLDIKPVFAKVIHSPWPYNAYHGLLTLVGGLAAFTTVRRSPLFPYLLGTIIVGAYPLFLLLGLYSTGWFNAIAVAIAMARERSGVDSGLSIVTLLVFLAADFLLILIPVVPPGSFSPWYPPGYRIYYGMVVTTMDVLGLILLLIRFPRRRKSG